MGQWYDISIWNSKWVSYNVVEYKFIVEGVAKLLAMGKLYHSSEAE